LEEIPPVRPWVVKLITYRGECECCGPVGTYHPLQTSYGQGAAKVQLGPRALVLAACLNKVHGLTMRKTCRVLYDLCGLRITAGGLSQALSRVAGRVKWIYEKLIEDIRGSPAVFADETGWWVYAKHKCIAHHLRAISKAMKYPHTDDHRYLFAWKSFFHGVIALYNLRKYLSEEDFAGKRKLMEDWRDKLLNELVNQPGDVSVRNRLLKQRNHLLGCLYEPAAEPTNNRAERALRPAVISRKVSCGNKTERGRDCWEILSSIGATCQQQVIDFVEYLSSHLPLTVTAG